MKIFKYTDHHAIDVVRDCRVKVSVPNRLNDPFEFLPKIDPKTLTMEWALNSLRQEEVIKEFFEQEDRRHGFCNFSDYKQWHLQNLKQIAEERLQIIREHVEFRQEAFAEGSTQHWRVFCASRRRNSILMWSHYAKNHEGVVIELDTDEPDLFRANGEFTFDVKYSKERSSSVNSRDVDQFGKEFLRIAGTKSSDWKYEEEVRLVFARTDCVDDCFVPIAKSTVKSVVFGCRIHDMFEAQMLKILGHKDYAHVSIYRASQSKTRYELEFEQVKR